MLARSIRSRVSPVAVIAGILMLSAGCALADKVEMRKLPSYSAFEGFVLPADAPEDPAWLITAYEQEGWQVEAAQDDWDRRYALEWQAAGGKLIMQELKGNSAGTSCTYKLDGFTGNLNCNYSGGDTSKANCQLRVVRDDAEEVEKNGAWVRMADVELGTVSFDAKATAARRFKRAVQVR